MENRNSRLNAPGILFQTKRLPFQTRLESGIHLSFIVYSSLEILFIILERQGNIINPKAYSTSNMKNLKIWRPVSQYVWS